MADVTVNIRGDASQLRDELDNVSRNPSSDTSAPTPSGGRGGGSAVPSNDRMIEDVRREMQQRGVLLVPGSSSMTQIINQYGQATRGAVNDRISERYDARRDDMRKRMSSDYDAIEADIDKRRQEGLQRLGPNANDPFYTAMLDQQLEQERQRQYRMVGSQYDKEEEQINQEEANERTQAETELTAAIRELTEYFNRQANQGGDAPDSYIGRLRAQQRELMQQRDSADSEEGAMAASRSLADVNEQLRRVLGGGAAQQGRPYYDSALQGAQGIQGLFSGLQSGDIGSTIMGGGSAIAGISGMGLKAALRFLGWVGVAAGAAKSLTGTSDSYESMQGLASLRATTGYQGGDASNYLGAMLPDANFRGINYTNFGYDTEEFAGNAARRTRARGTSDDWYAETMRQIGLERNLALSEGSLEKGGQYDRYGLNVTEAISRLVTILNGIEGSGVSMGDFTRVQEKYDIQQQIMGSYMNRADRPSYDVANANLAAFSAVQGITQDSRIGTDYQSFQNMIQQPMNERMRALIYSSVADLFPETGGRMDLIDRELRNPENEGKIMQSVIQRITQQFGGTDTQMGYFAFKSLLPDIAPDRLDQYISQFSDTGTMPGSILKKGIGNQGDFDRAGRQNMDSWAVQSTEFTTAWTKGKNEVVSVLNQILGKISGTTTMPTPNTTKKGGNN